MTALRSRFLTLAVLIAMIVAMAPALSSVDAAGGVVAYGDVVSGQLTNKSYFDIWEFSGNQGDRIQILMEGDGNLDPYLGLLEAATEQVLAEDDDGGGNSNAYLEVTLPSSGSFLIVATRYNLDVGTSQGAYELSLAGSGGPQNTANTTSPATSSNPVEVEPGVFYMGDLVLAEPVGGAIEEGSFAHLYSVEVEKGTNLVVAMLADGSDLDSYLVFVTEDGDVLAEDDDTGAQAGAGKVDAFINLTIPQTGVYFIIATRAGLETGKTTGAYALIAGVPEEEGPVQPEDTPEEDLPPGMEAMGMVEVGQSATAVISNDSFFHIYGIEGQAGDEITITMRGEGNLDAYLGFIDPSDEVIAEDDDSAGGTDAQISIRLPESGLYVIIATRNGIEQGTSTGNYTLEVTSGPPAATTSVPSFTGLPGRALMDEAGDTFYLTGNGASSDPAKNTPIESFAGIDLPGRGSGLNVPRPNAVSLNFEEIKVTYQN